MKRALLAILPLISVMLAFGAAVSLRPQEHEVSSWPGLVMLGLSIFCMLGASVIGVKLMREMNRMSKKGEQDD